MENKEKIDDVAPDQEADKIREIFEIPKEIEERVNNYVSDDSENDTTDDEEDLKTQRQKIIKKKKDEKEKKQFQRKEIAQKKAIKKNINFKNINNDIQYLKKQINELSAPKAKKEVVKEVPKKIIDKKPVVSKPVPQKVLPQKPKVSKLETFMKKYGHRK